MLDTVALLGLGAVAYAIGGVPFAFLAARRHGIDIRRSNNGNVGTVNTYRTVGWRAGTVVLVLDTAKGLLIVLPARLLGLGVWEMGAIAIAGVIGHNWSPYLRFAGGKGLAILFGISLGVMPVLNLGGVAVHRRRLRGDAEHRPLARRGRDRTERDHLARRRAGRGGVDLRGTERRRDRHPPLPRSARPALGSADAGLAPLRGDRMTGGAGRYASSSLIAFPGQPRTASSASSA